MISGAAGPTTLVVAELSSADHSMLSAVPHEALLAALAFLAGLIGVALYMVYSFEAAVVAPDNPEEGTELLQKEGSYSTYQVIADDEGEEPPAVTDAGSYADLSPLAVF